jgi:PQQ enzyme-like repeat protein
MRRRRNLIALLAATFLSVAGLVAPVTSSAASTASAPALSLTASRVLETATGTARTLAMPGGGYLTVHSYGEVTMVGPDGHNMWQRGTQSLYQDWDVSWEQSGVMYTPQLAWATDPVNPLEFGGGGPGGVDDVTPYAAGDLGGRPVVAVAEVVGVNLIGQQCSLCTWPFDVPGSSLHLGTFVTVLDGRTGRTLYHELDPGYVTQLAIAGGRLIIGDETGDPQRQGAIGEWGSVTTVRALAFAPSAGALTARPAWTYSTAVPWGRLLAIAVTGDEPAPGIAVAWSDTPLGLGVPAPPHGHVLLFDARTGALRWQVRTPGYPVLLAADNARGELAAVQLTDPAQATGYALTGLRYGDGATAVSVPRSGALPLSLAVQDGGDWAVGAVDGTVVSGLTIGYTPADGRVTLTDPGAGQDLWSAVLPAGSEGVPVPGGLVMARGQIIVGSWVGGGTHPTAASPMTQVDSITALSRQTGATDWQHTGDTGDPQSMSAAPGAGAVRVVSSNQVTETYSADGAVTTSDNAGPGDFLSAATASVSSPSSTDLVAGDQNGDVYAFSGRALARGQGVVLWRTRLPGPVHQLARAEVDGREVLVAAASNAVGMLDARTGRLLTLIQTPGTYAYTATVASAGGTPDVIVPGSSLTAYSLATGAQLWQYHAPSGAWFSDAAYADGVVAAEYANAVAGPFPFGGSATEMAAVGVSASTGAAVWVQQPDPSDIRRGQLWNGVIASPYIPDAGGNGVAFTWQTQQGAGQVDVRDIRTGALLYSDTADYLSNHTDFLADPAVGLIAESGQGAVPIGPAGGQGASTLSGLSLAIGKGQDGSPALLVAKSFVAEYPPAALTDPALDEFVDNETYNAGTLVSGDFAGNGSRQVVAIPQDGVASSIVTGEAGGVVNPFTNALQHGLEVLTVSDSGAAAAGRVRTPAVPAAPMATGAGTRPIGQVGATAPAPEPVRSGTAQPAASPATARHTASGLAAGAEPAGYAPAQVRGYLGLTGDGTGQTIAIADAYDDPGIASDAEMFSEQYGLPGVCGAGGTAGDCFTLDVDEQDPSAGSNAGWALETSLDVEWAHSIAPMARIVLVEASDSRFASMFRAVDTAVATHPAAVSMSWGMDEFSDETYYDGHCEVSSTVCVVSSGDEGNPGTYPAFSPWVVAVGGTTLDLAADGSVSSEADWEQSGGGQSWVEPEPAYQDGVQHSGKRQMPDVAFDADPGTGVAVYDSVAYEGQAGWWEVGGTSVGAPSWSAILADADQLRTAKGDAPLTAAGFAVLHALYALPSAAIAPVTTGPENGWCPVGCTPGPGYDEITGLGSPRPAIDAELAAAG